MRYLILLYLVLLSCSLNSTKTPITTVDTDHVKDTILFTDTLIQSDTVLWNDTTLDPINNPSIKVHAHTYKCQGCEYESNELKDTLDHHVVLNTECKILNIQKFPRDSLPQSFQSTLPIITITYNHDAWSFTCGGVIPLSENK